jgi:hypothetical protein
MPGESGFVRLVTHLKALPEGIHRKPEDRKDTGEVHLNLLVLPAFLCKSGRRSDRALAYSASVIEQGP